MRGITKRQFEVLQYIRSSISERGYPPTIREIGKHFGITSTNGVNDHLRALENKGYLTRDDMKSRALRPTNLMLPGMEDVLSPPPSGVQVRQEETPVSSVAIKAVASDLLEVPILGRVTAGLPIHADENLLGTLHVDPSMVSHRADAFALRISGESMIDAGIMDGDLVFVKPSPTARRGEIVVAMIDGEATVKYFYPEPGFVRLQPANSTMSPILVRTEDFRDTSLLGVVMGVYRRYS